MKIRGFTIFELLFVIIILFILAALLFPFFAKAHEKGGPNCASNMKQLGLGIVQYVQDNDEMMPNIAQASGSPVTWRRMVYDYVKSKGVYQCPDRHDKASGPDGLPRSYSANYSGNYNGSAHDQGYGAFAGSGSKPLSSWTDLTTPATLISLCEVAGSNRPEFNIDDSVHFGPKTHLLWSAHHGGGNYLFADGHVKWKQPMDTQTLWYRNASRPLSANGLTVLKDTQARATR